MEQYTQNQLAAIREQMELEALLAPQPSLGESSVAGGDQLPATMRTLSPLEEVLKSLGRRQPQPELYDPSWEQQAPQLTNANDSYVDQVYNLIGDNIPFGDRGRQAYQGAGDIIDQTGRIVDGAVDYLGEPYQVSGAQFVEDGVTNTKEGIEQGKPLKALGGAGMVATAALPFAGGAAAKLFSNVPRGMATGGAIGLSPELASEALSADTLNAAGPDEAMMQLLKQQALLSKQQADLQTKANDAERDMDHELQSGKGPRYEAAQRKYRDAQRRYDDLNTSLTAVRDQINHMRNENSPENIRKQRALDLKQQADTPIKELYPWLPSTLSTAAGALSGGLGARAGYLSSKNYNDNAQKISQKWGSAVEDAYNPTDLVKAQRGASEAQHFGNQLDDLGSKSVAQKFSPSPHMFGAMAAGEGAQLLPTAIDYGRSSPGSELRKKTEKDFELTQENLPNILGRVGMGAFMGYMPYSIAKGKFTKKIEPERFDAETNAIKENFNGKDALSHYGDGRKLNKLKGVEDFYSSRQNKLQNDAQTRQSADRKLLDASPKPPSHDNTGPKPLRGRGASLDADARNPTGRDTQRQSPSRRQTSRKPSKAEEIKIREQIAKDKHKNNNRKPIRQDYERLEDFLSAKARAQKTAKGKFTGGYKGGKPKKK